MNITLQQLILKFIYYLKILFYNFAVLEFTFSWLKIKRKSSRTSNESLIENL